MIPKRQRVTKKIFPAAKNIKKLFHSKHFILKAVSDPSVKESKFSVVVSKKILKQATKRNLIKRRVYSVVREYKKIKDISSGIYVFFCKKDVGLLTYKEITQEVLGLLNNNEQ